MKIFGFFMFLFLLASPTYAQNKADAHRHKQILESPDEWKAEVRINKVAAPNRKLKRENMVRNQSFEGFSIYQEKGGYRIFFTDRQTKKTYEIRGVGQPHRPFSDLQWKNNRLFVFDSWSNPHHGVHYEFDAKAKKLNKILIFRDNDETNP